MASIAAKNDAQTGYGLETMATRTRTPCQVIAKWKWFSCGFAWHDLGQTITHQTGRRTDGFVFSYWLLWIQAGTGVLPGVKICIGAEIGGTQVARRF